MGLGELGIRLRLEREGELLAEGRVGESERERHQREQACIACGGLGAPGYIKSMKPRPMSQLRERHREIHEKGERGCLLFCRRR